jgi:hypothetical protein
LGKHLPATPQTRLPGTLHEIAGWADMGNAWTQKYIVQTYSRMRYTAMTGHVASKPRALTWAMDNLDAEWKDIACPSGRGSGFPVASGRPAKARQHATRRGVREVRGSTGSTTRVGAVLLCDPALPATTRDRE